MTLDQIDKSITNYRNSDASGPILVDVPTYELSFRLLEKYKVDSTLQLIDPSMFCDEDSFPKLPQMLDFLMKAEKDVMYFHLTPYLMLKGEIELEKNLKRLLDLRAKGHIVIITVACRRYLLNFDKRLFESGRIKIHDYGETDDRKLTLNLYPKDFNIEIDVRINGINNLYKICSLVRDDFNDNHYSVFTNKGKSDFPVSLYEINYVSSAFEMLKSCYSSDLASITEEMGTSEYWKILYDSLDDVDDNVYKYFRKNIGDPHNLHLSVANFSGFGDYNRWLFFIALKIYHVENNEYLAEVENSSRNYEEFINNSFCKILDYSVEDDRFETLYGYRKSLIREMSDYGDALKYFLKKVNGKGEDAIFYLTDNTKDEREMIIELIVSHADMYSYDELLDILKNVYHDLFLYMEPYSFDKVLLTDYFKLYRYCKLTNQILPEFEAMVMMNAKDRWYNSNLNYRDSYVSKLRVDVGKTRLYFMDAMGLEFVPYFEKKCAECELSVSFDVARCDLPSITSLNKGFIDDLRDRGCIVTENGKLDDLKHKGEMSYNYQNNKLPTHIIAELDIINGLIEQLRKLDVDEKAYVISDHGASRLAVIKESEVKIEMAEKGKHSGRCCPISEIDEQPEFATKENDFWCLANYDRFKGGRKASVEVHGGASIEEVAVPIISVKRAGKKVICELVDNNPIKVSYKCPARLLLFVEVDSDDISITVGGKSYKAEKTDKQYHYEVVMDDIRRKGEYIFSVYKEGFIIADNLKFVTKKEGASERKFF